MVISFISYFNNSHPIKYFKSKTNKERNSYFILDIYFPWFYYFNYLSIKEATPYQVSNNIKYFNEETGEYILKESKEHEIFTFNELVIPYTYGNIVDPPGIKVNILNFKSKCPKYHQSMDDIIEYYKLDHHDIEKWGFIIPIEEVINKYYLDFDYNNIKNFDDLDIFLNNAKNINIRANLFSLENSYFYFYSINTTFKTIKELVNSLNINEKFIFKYALKLNFKIIIFN